MRKSYESKWQCSRPRVMGADRKGRGQALTGVRAGQAQSLEKSRNKSGADTLDSSGRQYRKDPGCHGTLRTGEVDDPVHVRKAPHTEIGRSLNRPLGMVVRAVNPKGALQP